MNQTEQVARETEIEWQRRKRASGIGEHKRARATSVTGSDIDAAIQDERMVELERQINTLYAEAARQAGRIEKLEAADMEVARMQVAELQRTAVEQDERIEQLETCAVINAETIRHVAGLRRAAAEQGERIEKLWHWAHEQ